MRARLPMLLLRALIAAIVLAVAVRLFVGVPRSVPSESMMSALLPGDLIVALRWPYGAPFANGTPARGDIVVVRTPAGDVIKRVVGVGGDRVALRRGTVILNGTPLARFRVADYVYPESAASRCPAARREPPGHGGRVICRIRRYREMLPDGRDWDTLDRGGDAGGTMRERVVPKGRLFLLGDNRDRSGDSRFPPAAGGLGLVEVHAVQGHARFVLWSVDADALASGWPAWWKAARRERIGRTLLVR